MSESSRSDISIAILAGGRSRRMGRDKALLRVGDETFLERTFRIASGTGCRTMVVGRRRPDHWPHADTLFLDDDYPGFGPLGGLASALRYSGDAVLLLPCDMPRLTADAIKWLIDIAATISNTDGLIVRNGERIEPLFSLYFSPSLSSAEERIGRNAPTMREFIAAGDFGYVDIPSEHVGALHNVNTPEEMR